MALRAPRARALLAVVVIVACALALVAHRKASSPPRTLGGPRVCKPTVDQLEAFARRATDTITRLRDRVQAVTAVRREPGGVVVRTEDTNRLANHDGGKVSFDCEGHVRVVWLDGG